MFYSSTLLCQLSGNLEKNARSPWEFLVSIYSDSYQGRKTTQRVAYPSRQKGRYFLPMLENLPLLYIHLFILNSIIIILSAIRLSFLLTLLLRGCFRNKDMDYLDSSIKYRNLKVYSIVFKHMEFLKSFILNIIIADNRHCLCGIICSYTELFLRRTDFGNFKSPRLPSTMKNL